MTKIALLKPDYGVAGGFERVLEKLQVILEDAGYDVTRHTIDLAVTAQRMHERRIERDLWDSQREYLTYLYGRDCFDGINTSVYDLVVSTAPPSYVHRHRRHLALFYHHQRVFYDLEDLYISAGFPQDAHAHRHAAAIVRSLDQDRFDQVANFLCPSDTVQGRLDRFNSRRATFPFHAGIGLDDHESSVVPEPNTDPTGRRGALCVGRHEFPKRTELVVAAAHLVDPMIPMICTGTGGRLAWSVDLDRRLGTGELDPTRLDAAALWCNTGAPPPAPTDPEPARTTFTEPARTTFTGPARTTFTGRVDDDRLEQLYRDACCVVAPAYDEDYGLTAIEAMAHGRPVVTCDDSGGLAELVEHERTGLIVAPTPVAIAAAVTRLHDDAGLAAQMGRNGRERAAELTWASAARQLLTAVEATLDGPCA